MMPIREIDGLYADFWGSGYDQGVFGNVIINENFLETFGHPSADTQGTMTSIYNIGCFVGAMSTIITGDIFGRPRQIILGSTIIAVGAVIQSSAYGVPQMMVGRVVAGLGTGMNTATAGVWQSETRYDDILESLFSILNPCTVRCAAVASS
jgi:MFS family permease